MIDVTCIIPARGGSKRLPEKNIALLQGRPLIAYAIEAWKESRYYERPAIVSTDSDVIGTIASGFGAEIIKRPGIYAQDDTPMIEVVEHVMHSLEKYQHRRIHWILLLQPTSPLRVPEDIDDCLDIIARNEADSLSSICPEVSTYNTKENGAVYITHTNIIRAGTLNGQRHFYYMMPPERSIDIDTAEDLARAEAILKGGQDDNLRVLHELEGPEPGKGDDKKRKGKRRGVGKISAIRRKQGKG